MSFHVQLGREVIDIAADTIHIGVTTEEIDRIVHEVSTGIKLYQNIGKHSAFS